MLFIANYVLVKTQAADIYLINQLEPKPRVCISDKDRMRMLKKRPILLLHWGNNFKNKHCINREIEAAVYVNQDKSLSDLQALIKQSLLLYFPHEFLMYFLIVLYSKTGN